MRKESLTRRAIIGTVATGVITSASTAAAQNDTNETETNETVASDTNTTSTNNTQTNETTETNETETDSDSDQDEDQPETGDEQQEEETESGGGSAECSGAPRMSRTSVTSPQNRITAEDPATVEANFRVDPNVPTECKVNIDLQYSFAQSGFQFGGGSGWEQSATDIVATTFNGLESGEIRSIDAQIYTNGAEPGDEVTIIAEYEIWFEGNRDESYQQSGIRQTVEVEAINEPDSGTDDNEESQEDDSVSIDVETPGFGVGTSIAALGSAAYMIKRRLQQ